MLDQVIDLYKQTAMKRNHILTVFMTTHNREYYVKLAIESVLKQTYKDFMLIVLDNCSEDHTASVVQEIQDERVLYLYRKSEDNDPNFWFALDKCVTKYCIVLHDDDLLYPDYIETVLNEMENHEYDILSVSADIINESGEVISRHTKNDKKDRYVWREHEYFSWFFNRSNKGMVFPSVIYRTDFMKKIRYPEWISEIGPAVDQYLYFQVERNGGVIALLDKPYIYYRYHKSQDSFLRKGYMDYDFVEYMMHNDYYNKLLEENKLNISRKLYLAYKGMLLKYGLGYEKAENLRGILKRPSMLFFKGCFGCRKYLWRMKLFYHSRLLILIYIQINKARYI